MLIDVLRGRKRRAERLRELLLGGHILASCAVTEAEVFAGMRAGEEQATERLTASLRYYDLVPAAARLAGRLKHDWTRRGKTLSLADCLIAAAALHYRLTLMTDNVKHYPMPELEVRRPG